MDPALVRVRERIRGLAHDLDFARAAARVPALDPQRGPAAPLAFARDLGPDLAGEANREVGATRDRVIFLAAEIEAIVNLQLAPSRRRFIRRVLDETCRLVLGKAISEALTRGLSDGQQLAGWTVWLRRAE